MRFLAGIRNDEDRSAAEQALLKGKSPDAVKIAVRPNPPPLPGQKLSEEDLRARLEKEKLRLERTIASLSKRLSEVEQELGNH
jgi:hypothetical protein